MVMHFMIFYSFNQHFEHQLQAEPLTLAGVVTKVNTVVLVLRYFRVLQNKVLRFISHRPYLLKYVQIFMKFLHRINLNVFINNSNSF